MTDTDFIDADIEAKESELELLSGMIRNCVMMNASASLTEQEYQAQYTELSQRYESAKAEYGIVVAGFDLRGHGENPSIYDTATLGKTGWEESLRDMHYFRMMLQQKYPGLPLYMMGFSLGSFLQREYLNLYRAPAGVILVGTGTQPALILSILMKVIDGEIRKFGFNRNTALVQKLSFETYNRKFAPNVTSADWLCADRNQLDRYLNDRDCRNVISAGLFYQLLASMKRTGNADAYRNWNKAMPVLLISGQDDPVGNMGKGARKVLGQMKKAGMRNVQLHLYPGARHDVLHEEITGTADSIRSLLFEWLLISNERS